MELFLPIGVLKIILPLLAIIAGVFVITTKNAIISVFNLIVLYILVAFYLIYIGITYLGISYIVVYIGAIAILFLFVIMMIDIEVVEKRSNNYLPLLFLLLGGFFFTLKNILYNIGIVKMKSLSINIIKKPIIHDNLFNRFAEKFNLDLEFNLLNEKNNNGDNSSEEEMPDYIKIEKLDNLMIDKLAKEENLMDERENKLLSIYDEWMRFILDLKWLRENIDNERQESIDSKLNWQESIDLELNWQEWVEERYNIIIEIRKLVEKWREVKDKLITENGYLIDDKLIEPGIEKLLEKSREEEDKLITEGGYVWDLDVKFNKLFAYNYEEELQNYNYLMVVPNWNSAANRVTQISAIGDVLYTVYHSYIYIISVLLLLGMIGAIILTADSPQPVRIIKKLASVSNSQRQAQNNISLTQLNKKSGINIGYVILVLFIIIIIVFLLYLWIRSDYIMEKSYLIVKKKDGDNYLSGLKNGFSKKKGNGHILPLRVKRDLKEITKEYWEMKEKMGEDNIMILEFKYYTRAWLNKTFPSPKVKKIIPKINKNNKSLTQLSKISGINIGYLISGLFIIIVIILWKLFIKEDRIVKTYSLHKIWDENDFIPGVIYKESIREYGSKSDHERRYLELCEDQKDLKEVLDTYKQHNEKDEVEEMGEDNIMIIETIYYWDRNYYTDERIPLNDPRVIRIQQVNKKSKVKIKKDSRVNNSRKSLILPFLVVSNSNTLHTEEIIGNLFYFIVATLIIAALLLFINSYFSLSVKYLDKGGGFECGFTSFVQTRERFNVIFYRVSLLFLVFDLEIILIFPYTAIYQKYQNISKNNVLAFLYILIVGFIYELKEGALNIVKKAHTTEINNLE